MIITQACSLQAGLDHLEIVCIYLTLFPVFRVMGSFLVAENGGCFPIAKRTPTFQQLIAPQLKDLPLPCLCGEVRAGNWAWAKDMCAQELRLVPFLPPPWPLKWVSWQSSPQEGLCPHAWRPPPPPVPPWDPSVGDKPGLCLAVIMPTFLSNTKEIVNISPHDTGKKGGCLR